MKPAKLDGAVLEKFSSSDNAFFIMDGKKCIGIIHLDADREVSGRVSSIEGVYDEHRTIR
jgi:hypothetical protein